MSENRYFQATTESNALNHRAKEYLVNMRNNLEETAQALTNQYEHTNRLCNGINEKIAKMESNGHIIPPELVTQENELTRITKELLENLSAIQGIYNNFLIKDIVEKRRRLL